MSTTISGGINFGPINVGISHEVSHKNYPAFFTIEMSARQAIIESPRYSSEKALHGLLVATYEGEFDGRLFFDKLQPTKREKEISALANKLQNNTLQAAEEKEAFETLTTIYQKHFPDRGAPSKELLYRFFVEPQWEGLSSKKIGNTSVATTATGELRPLASAIVTEEHLLLYLSTYEGVFREFFPKYTDKIKTFADLKKEFPTEFQHFLRTKPNDYRLEDNWQRELQKFKSDVVQESFFLQEFKKMKISGKTFEAWLKRFLNGDFDR